MARNRSEKNIYIYEYFRAWLRASRRPYGEDGHLARRRDVIYSNLSVEEKLNMQSMGESGGLTLEDIEQLIGGEPEFRRRPET